MARKHTYNTLDKGAVRYILFKENETWYAVGLEFNLVIESDDPNLALYDLFDAMTGYVNAARKIKARPFALNQLPDREYEDMWTALVTKRENDALKNIEVSDFGHHLVAA